MANTKNLIKILRAVTIDLRCTIELLNNECQPGFMNNVVKAERLLKKVTPDDKTTQIILIVGINEKRRSKIAYNLGQYTDDLPDNVECEDWLVQLLSDKFKSLPEALDVATKIRKE